MVGEQDLFTSNPAVFSVSELTARLRAVVEASFPFVMVSGEVSNCRSPASGHIYFDLKDDSSVLGAVVWKGQALKMRHRPSDGLQVVVHGRVTSYQSKLQIVVEYLEPAGLGAWLKLLEERKAKLLAEGLFAPERKKPLPLLPDVVGIITSETGDVVHDILTRFKARGLRHILIWPAKVQGEGAVEEMVRAIQGFNALPVQGQTPRPEVIILARGGGSLEDLWAFNEEALVRAVAASQIPIVTGVGHEPDVTLADYAADRRAPTPTAAAEMVVPDQRALLGGVMMGLERLSHSLNAALQHRRLLVKSLARGLPDLDRLLTQTRLRFDDRIDRLFRAFHVATERKAQQLDYYADRVSDRLLRQFFIHRVGYVERLAQQLGRAQAFYFARQREKLGLIGRQLHRQNPQGQIMQLQQNLGRMERLLNQLSPKAPLAKGYAYVTTPQGQLVRRAADLSPGQAKLHFMDGTKDVEVKS